MAHHQRKKRVPLIYVFVYLSGFLNYKYYGDDALYEDKKEQVGVGM